MIKVAVKTGIALAAAIFGEGDILLKFGIFGIVYALLAYYVWYMNKRGGGFSVFVGNGGLMATLMSFAFMILSPLIPLVVLALIMNSLGLSETATAVISVLMILAAFGCFALDVIRILKPELLTKKDHQ